MNVKTKRLQLRQGHKHKLSIIWMTKKWRKHQKQLQYKWKIKNDRKRGTALNKILLILWFLEVHVVTVVKEEEEVLGYL